MIRENKVGMMANPTGAKLLLAFLGLILIIWSCSTPKTQVNKDVDNRNLADQYYQKKEYDKAKQALLLNLKQKPYDVQTHYRLGVIYGHENAIDKSKAAFEKVIAIDPGYSKAYYNLGVLYSKGSSIDHVKKSIRHFDTFLELEPSTDLRPEIERWKTLKAKNITEGVKK